MRRFPVRQADFFVLQAPDVPSLLVELGFLSNATDASNLHTETWQRRTAEALSDLERALAILEARPQAPRQHAEVELALARALTTRDPVRARNLATTARDRLPTQGPGSSLRRSAEALLGRLPRP